MGDQAADVVRTVCAPNCGGRALIDCEVRDGRLQRVRPAEHPDAAYRGACIRCVLLPHWVHAPDRLTTPLRRRRGTARGTAVFDPVSWDEALDEIAGTFAALLARQGGPSIGFSRSSGASPLGDYRRLGSLLGASNLFGGVDMAVHMGLNAVLGNKGMFGQSTNEWTDRARARVQLVWGNNPAETSMTSFRHLLDAQEEGSTLVVIDPRYSATAVHADWWIAPRPGTDLALALGLLNIVLDEGLIDEDLTLRVTVGPALVRRDTGRFVRIDGALAGCDGRGDVLPLDAIADPRLRATVTLPDGTIADTAHALLVDHVADFSPERVAGITGIAADDVVDLARLYATGPSSIGFGYGVDRYTNGEALTQAAATLALLTANIGRPGATVGVQSHGHGYRGASLGTDGDLPPGSGMVSVPNALVGREPVAVRALFNAGDWLNQRIADMNTGVAWLRTLDLVVTVDHVWNTTCEWSDIVLPASTFLEGAGPRDVVVHGNCVSLRTAVVPPVAGSRSDADIERGLAERLGLGQWFVADARERIDHQLRSSPSALLRHLTVDALVAAGGSVRLDVPDEPNVQYTDLAFGTPSGRAEVYLEALAPLGDALPRWRGDVECLADSPDTLVLVQNHVRQRAHSTFATVAPALERWPEPTVELNPEAGVALGVRDGELVEVHNDRGRVVVRACFNADYPPGLCSISEGWKGHQYRAGNVQELTNPARSAAQELAWGQSNIPFYDTRVRLRPHRGARP